MRQILRSILVLYAILKFFILQINCFRLDLQESSACFQIQNIGGNQASVTSIVYIQGTTLVSVSDQQGYSYIYDIFDGTIHQTSTTANPPILGQIFYPNLLQATLSQQRFSVVDLLQKQEIVGIQNQGISYLSLIVADISKTKQEQLSRGSQKQSSLIVLNNRKTQTIQIKPSSLDNNFYPSTDNFDYLIQVKGLGNGQQGIFGMNNQNQNQYQLIEDFVVNPNSKFPTIPAGGRNSLLIAINSGQFNSVYSYLINLSILDQQKPVDFISPIILPATVNSFKKMNSTNYLLISYGAPTKFQGGGGGGGGGGGNQFTSPLPLQQNSLCAYDFGNAQNLLGTSYGVDTLSILLNPIICINMGTNQIMAIQSVFMNNKNYVVFSLLSSQIFIFENTDLINSKFSILTSNLINFQSQINGFISIMLQIPNTSILIIGTTQGQVASLDISNPTFISLTTQQQSQTLQITPLFSKIGIGSNGFSIGDIMLDSQTQTVIGITKNSLGQGMQQFGQQQLLFQYNLASQQRVLNSTRSYQGQQPGGGGGPGPGQQGQITIEQTVVFSTPSFLTLTSVTKQYYPIPSGQTKCPQQTPNPAPTLTPVKTLSLATQTQLIPLDVQTDNLNPLLIPGMLSYTSELNDKYVVLLLVTQPFQFSQYCIQNQKFNRLLQTENEQQYFSSESNINQQNRILQSSQISLNIYIINSLGVSVCKTSSNFYQLSSISQAPFQFIKDSVQNMFIVFQNSIMIIKPSVNTPSSFQTTTITLQNISTLASLADVVQILKITILNPINQIFIQLIMSDGSYITVIISYNQQWVQNQNQDLQLTLINTINNTSNPQIKSLLTFNTIYYMQSQNILAVQYNTNTDLIQYNMTTNSLNLQLTLYNISDSNTRFFSITSDNSLYQLMLDGEIKRIYAPQCYNQSCINIQCSIKTLLNTQASNSLQDILQKTTSNILLRQEQIYNQVLDYQNFITKVANIQIKRYFYFGSDSVYNIQYIHYKQIVSQQYLTQNNISMRLSFHTFNTSLPTNTSGGYQNLPPLKIYGDSPFSFDNYIQVSFRNILWNVNIDNYIDQTQPLIQIQNNISFFERFNILTYSIKNPNSILDNFNQFQIQSGSSATFRNMTIQNKNYQSANYFIQVPSTIFNLTLENIIVQNCKFESTVFVSASNQLFLNATNIQFNNNIITLSQSNQLLSTFMSAQSIALQGFQFQQNSVQQITLFGKTYQSQYFVANISNILIAQNAFFISDQSFNILILNVQFLQAIESQTYANFTRIIISQNRIFSQAYNPSIFNQYLTEINNNQNQQLPDNQINDMNTFISPKAQSQYFFFCTQYIQSIYVQNVNITDNKNIGFYQSSYLNLFQADLLNYKNIQLNQSETNSACIKITEFNTLSFQLTNSLLENLSIQNDYLIYIKTSQFNSLDQQQISTFKIDGLIIKNIKISTSSEYNQASILFLNSLLQNKVFINNLNVANVLIQTPLQVFYDMASTLTLLMPFSSAQLTNSNFLNFYTQSIKEVLYLNVQDLIMENNNFENNQFQTNAPLLGTNGGFILVQSKTLNMTKNSFYRGSSLNGAAVTITPTSSNPQFNFTNCIFSNLISFQYGGAVYINNPPANTIANFFQCQFTSLIANEGGSIYSYFTIRKALNNNKPEMPNIIITSPRINQTFASSQGSFISFYNMNVSLNDVIIDINNPLKQINLQQNILFQQIRQYQTVGSVFSVQNSNFTITNSQLNQIFCKQNQQQSSVINLQQKSTGNLQNVKIIQGSFSNGGALLVDTQSQILMNLVEIQKMNYQLVSSLRQIEQVSDSNLQLTQNQYQTQAVSAFIIRSFSQFQISQLTMNLNQCSNLFCVGSALSIVQSSGQIDKSIFTNNTSSNKGGAVSLINESGQVKIMNSLFQYNSANQEGGGLFIYQNVDLIQPNQKIIIFGSQFLQNSAFQGGGIYLNSFSQNSKLNSADWIQISDSKIMNNTANFLGGGIQYTGFDPEITSSTVISLNTAGKKYGGNLFSRPFKLQFNQKLTQQSNQNQIQYGVQYDPILQLERLQIGIQVSGDQLPDLIFELVDENNQVIDGSYESVIGSQIYAQVQPYGKLDDKNAFQISSSIQKITFTDYFNLTDISITGVPNSSISIQLSSPFINNPNYPENSYFYIIDIHLRDCIQGEVYKKGQVIYNGHSYNIFGCSKCPEGQYSLSYPNLNQPIFECQKCISNTNCLGGNVISLKEGFWRENDQTDEILQCINKQNNCLGGPQNFTCNTGHIGPLCESCDISNGYSRQGNFQCSKCGDIVNNTFKVLGLVVLYIVCAKMSVDGVLQRIMFIIKRKEQLKQEAQKQGASSQFIKNSIKREEVNASILLKLIISYFQIIMVVTTFQISFPSVFNSPIDVIANPTVQVLYSFECFFHEISLSTGVNIIYVQFIASVCLPILCVLVFIITGLIKYRGNSFLKRFYISTSLIYCLMYFQPSLYKDAVSILSCRSIGDHRYIQYNVLYTCYTDEHILWSLSLILPILLIISVIIPGFMMYKVYKSKDSILKRKNYMFIIGEYDMSEKRKIWYWEFLKMYMKLLIMSILIIYEYSIPNKILLILLIVVLYGFFLVKVHPYSEQLYNKIDIYSTFVLTTSIYLAFIAYENKTNYAWLLSSVIGIATINTVFLIWCFKKLAYAYFPMVKKTYFEFKFLCFKFSPFKCFYTKKTATIYKFQKLVKLVQNELKKRNIINAWTGKIKVPLENIIDLIIQGREQMKNGSKLDLNTSMKNRSQAKIVSLKKINLQSENQINEKNNVQKPLQLEKQLKSDNEIESINFEFPSENLIHYQNQNPSIIQLVAQQIPQSFLQNESVRAKINKLKSTSIIQDMGTNRNLLEIVPISSRFDENFGTQKLIQSPLTARSNENDQLASLKKIIQFESFTPKNQFHTTDRQIQEDQMSSPIQNQIISEIQNDSENDVASVQIPIEHLNNTDPNNQQNIQKLNRNILQKDQGGEKQDKGDIENQIIINNQKMEDSSKSENYLRLKDENSKIAQEFNGTQNSNKELNLQKLSRNILNIETDSQEQKSNEIQNQKIEQSEHQLNFEQENLIIMNSSRYDIQENKEKISPQLFSK
ncbi:transmembrane protein, putative (macronuclear) [Tetrahymena thermophila SB210]|uniref:Transmembrane protein, putative n=1 Tax=Tetrahymena thermophila (strain SB210) TaxID=312017 RepID=W7XE54_TETTS|nr:transmembrane protein, putative [Tetrahymena thermophila SB210]EWS74813.1 transmembrane protein, putative [Tetrahymena thermophila SB210]|eukprot:XP_012652644.1 transmembrane protein, putative [Tetrahymena thermophila SB210]